ncbi:hypothetical protein G9A89_000819 [Geosiphon pyriformis]|nr:hypothetical protein G9A89_000819 [Geosiphon pyriformis]
MSLIVNQSAVAAGNMCLKSTSKPRSPISKPESVSKSRSIPKHLPANDTAANLSITSISNFSLSTTATSNISTTATCNISTAATSNLSTSINSTTATKFTMVVYQLIPSFSNAPLGSCSWNSGTSVTQNPNSQNYLSLLVTPANATPNNLETNPTQKLTSNILSAIVTNNKSLAAIFSFKLEEPSQLLLFSGATLEKKPITAMYIDAKVDEHPIKLILDSGEIDDFPIEINGIIIPIKVLVMEATQYQVLVGNNWLSKTNAILNWTMQKLQLSQNGQYTRASAICRHFKPTNLQPLIEFEEEAKKPT